MCPPPARCAIRRDLWSRPGRIGAVAAWMLLLAAGCAAPYGVRQTSPRTVYRSVNATVLGSGELSIAAETTLRRQGVAELFDADPALALQVLRSRLQANALPAGDVYALAELSFYHGEHGGGRPYFLAAALYAYAFLFPADERDGPEALDPRLRDAADLYARGLTEAFRGPEGDEVAVAPGVYPLPFGWMAVSFDPEQLRWDGRMLERFAPASELTVTGFRNRYREPGIGVPLAAATRPASPAPQPVAAFAVGPYVRVPVTLFLRIPHATEQVRAEQVTAELELYPGATVAVTEIDGRTVPLAQEPTAALALALSEARPWTADLTRFLGRVLQTEVTTAALAGTEPHRHGRIPVVLVHGTASNFSVWANMVNDLATDPVIRTHFEFWVFRYDSGQPILYSSMQLRRALTDAVAAFQAVAPDPCLEQMVVVGHSQGGLLVKMTAVHSGDRFWRNLSDRPLAEARMPDETRALLQELMFVDPLPFVRRVIFIATPHRGSYLASPSIVRRLAQRLISLPAALVQSGAGLLRTDVAREARLERLPTSIDNMSPGNPFIETIAAIPVAPEVHAHSIIGVAGDGPLDREGDGVVKYTSAHIDGVESELIVHAQHSMQSKAEVIAEVQRILLHHLERNACAPISEAARGALTGTADPHATARMAPGSGAR